MVRDVKLLQKEKAAASIDVTEFGIDTEVKLLQPLKARRPIDATELGMVYDVPVFLTGYCIKMVFVLLYKTPFSELYVVLPLSTLMDVKLLPPQKASFSIVFTELGIVTDVKLTQEAKALLPINVTEFPIVTDIMLPQ